MTSILLTTIAAALSLLVAKAFGLVEAYWAVVTTVIVTQSSLGSTWDVSRLRLVGTVIGGITAAALLLFLKADVTAFVIGLVGMGLLCALVGLDRSAFRFAGVTLAVIMLPSSHAPIWTRASHRFFEVTVGILVGMATVVSASSLESFLPIEEGGVTRSEPETPR